MKLDDCRVDGSKKFVLAKCPTSAKMDKSLKKEYLKKMAANTQLIAELQEKLYAEKREGVIFAIQAMDAGGKDSAIKHVLTGVNPQGISVANFKAPTKTELAHDYLWRVVQSLPERGMIGIFNRSHYEELLIYKVKKLWETQAHADRISEKDLLNDRYKDIKNYERYLWHNSIRTVKFFLNVSKKEQARRFLSRIEEPEKNWKFSASDYEERKYWDAYQEAFETAINKTSTEEAPWYVIPADHKWYMRYVVSEIILHTLKEMNPKYPEVTKARLEEFARYRKELEEELGE